MPEGQQAHRPRRGLSINRQRRRKHHQADRQQSAQRLEAADEVEHHQPQEDEMHRRAQAGDRAQEQWIEAFGDQSAPEDAERQPA